MKQALIVGAGAGCGAAARQMLTLALAGGLWPLLVINVLGSAAMGWAKPGPFWGAGFLGGFTSFAAFALLASQQPAAMAATYVTLTVVGCPVAYLAGDFLRRARR